MSFDAQTLFNLLPAIHRIRDAELAKATHLERGPLEELLAVFAEQIGVVEENLEQLYDDLFIETCADWVIPYIGDLIGYQTLHGVVPKVASPRAEVAHTIALRRRKGTALVLEQLARDVTGWDARAVEFFEHIATTQYMNHTRPHNLSWLSLRDSEALEWTGSAFETAKRTVDVRHIESGRGRHNIPNVGLFLWRIDAYSRSKSPAVRVGARRYRISPLNHDISLYNRPRAEDDITHLAEPVNVPLPLSRRRLTRHLARHYGTSPAASINGREPGLILWLGGNEVARDDIAICDLSDIDPSDPNSGWAHTPSATKFAIDPALGRVVLPETVADADANPADVRLTWHEGFGTDLGGGEYEREDSFGDNAVDVSVSGLDSGLSDALAAIAGNGGVIEITDSGRYTAPATIQINANTNLEIRAAAGCRPTVILNAPLDIQGGDKSSLSLNGLLISGERLRIPSADNQLTKLNIAHCTLVPGYALKPDGTALFAAQPSLAVDLADVEVNMVLSISGALHIHARAEFSASDSIIDAISSDAFAYAADQTGLAGGSLSLNACTVIGRIHARQFGEVSNSILLATAGAGEAPVRTEHKQQGCVRFSYLPVTSIVPRRYRCQPTSDESAGGVTPRFNSRRYGTPAYCQLALSTPDAIRRGAEDENEMGVYHHLYGAQRETNLRIRLDEYLRVGLRAGIFYES